MHFSLSRACYVAGHHILVMQYEDWIKTICIILFSPTSCVSFPRRSKFSHQRPVLRCSQSVKIPVRWDMLPPSKSQIDIRVGGTRCARRHSCSLPEVGLCVDPWRFANHLNRQIHGNNLKAFPSVCAL